MKYLRTAPLFLLLLFTGVLFTILGIAGKTSIYGEQSYDPVKEPVLSVVFKAAKDEIYPWQLFEAQVLTEGDSNIGETKQDADPGAAPNDLPDADSDTAPEALPCQIPVRSHTKARFRKSFPLEHLLPPSGMYT